MGKTWGETWYVDAWLGRPHWQTTSPLVFINGCHTAELTPQTLVTFVDTFARAGAAGVVGTEITVHQTFASEAAQSVITHVAGPSRRNVGEALRRMRLHFLEKRNLLGLAYTAYCSSELHLRG